MSRLPYFPVLAFAALVSCMPVSEGPIREAVTFYASFDEGTNADFGGRPEPRIDSGAAHLEPGVQGQALWIEEPGRGAALAYAAHGNLPDPRGAWSGTLSFWIRVAAEAAPGRVQTLVQIATECASPGGLSVEYVGGAPPELRLAAVSAGSGAGWPQPAVTARLRNPARGDWRHVAVAWANFDSGRSDAWAALYLDGDMAGTVTNAAFRSGWEGGEGLLCVGLNYQGAIDELAVLSRPLSQKEIRRLAAEPSLLAALKARAGGGAAQEAVKKGLIRYPDSARR